MQSTTKHRSRGLSTVVAFAPAFALATPMPARSGAGAIRPQQLQQALQPGPAAAACNWRRGVRVLAEAGRRTPGAQGDRLGAAGTARACLFNHQCTGHGGADRGRKRGVEVRILVDLRSNFHDDRNGKARATLGALSLAGIRARSIGGYPIHHDKVFVADRSTVQTGSFNYPAAAANADSEHVLLLWGHPQLAQAYLGPWERNWRQGSAWQPAC